MAYSFDEIMAYHPDNVDVYREIKRFLPKLVPFVGAGLTKFAYCSWPKALEMLSNKLTNGANAQMVADLINSKHYLEAAQLLEDFRAPVNLARDLAGIFTADKLEQKREQLPKEPISLLPYLFPELVLTTNFDETLETIYREGGHPFQTVFLPGHPELLRQLTRQGGVRSLFKLHGTVTGGLIEYEKIVFTQVQYDRHYGKGSPLTFELKDCFKNRMMLFLGCSLESDRTMELLQEVIQPGDSYYTVISCEPLERDEKVKQLGEKNIRAILYEKDRHEAVRVILEHLLEETNPQSYKGVDAYDMPQLRVKVQQQAKVDNTVQLGTMVLNSGELQKAAQYYEEVIKIDSNHIGAYLGLVRALDIEKSKPFWNKLEEYKLESVSEFLKHNPEMLLSQPVSLLDRAVSNSQSIELIKVMLDAGSKPDDNYILYHAIVSKSTNKFQLMKLLLDFGTNPNQEYKLKFDSVTEMCTPLRDAIWQSKDCELAKLLIDYGADVNYISKSNNDESWSLLDMAVRSGNEQMVQLLLENGADANSGRWAHRRYWLSYVGEWAYEKVFFYALSDAIWSVKNANIVKLLLANGANPNYQYLDIHQDAMRIHGSYYTDHCSGLYDVICFTDSTEILKLMLDFGADPMTKYECTWTDIELDDQKRTLTMLELANNKNKVELAKILNCVLQKREEEKQQKREIELLEIEQATLQANILQVKGLFADKRRKKCTERLNQVEERLKKLKGE